MSGRVSRRGVIGAGASLLGCALAGARRASAASGPAPAHVVFVHLRGGADGLSLLVPYTSDAYYRARRSTAIAPPGRAAGSALAISDELALHPELGALRACFFEGELAAVLGVGSPVAARSHASAWRSMDEAIKSSLNGESPEALTGCFAAQLGSISKRIREREAARSFHVESLGWDTHAAQGDGRHGRFASAAAELDSGLHDFRASLGGDLSRVLVVVLSEFGRSLPETPLEGTDDGDASVIFLLGGGRHWGRVFGRSPSLEPDALTDGRHLRADLDLGDVLARVVRGEDPIA